MAWCHKKNSSYSCLAIGFLLLSFVTRVTYSQTQVEKYGVQLEVDQISSTGVGQSLVQIGGQEQIVSDVRLSTVVVREYLNREELFKRLTLVKVLALIQGAISNKDDQLYDESLAAVSRYVTDSDEGFSQFFSALASQPQVIEKINLLLQTASPSSISPSVLPELLAILVLDTTIELTQPVKEAVVSKASQVKNSLKNRFFSALKDANPNLAKLILSRLITVYGSEDPDAKSLSTVLTRVESSTSLSEFTGILVELSASDPQLRRSLATIAIDLLHDRVKKFIEDGKSIEALHELSGVDVDRRTPRTHQLATTAIQNLKSVDFLNLQVDTKSRDFIKYLSTKDQNFRDAVLLTLENEIVTIFSTQSFSKETYTAGFALLNDVRPEPNALNDRIRIKCIEQAYLSGDTSSISFVKSDIRSSLTFFDETKLITLYLKSNLILIIFVFIVLLGLVVFSVRKLRKFSLNKDINNSSPLDSAPVSDETIEEEVEDDRPLFVKGRTTNSKYPALYVELLAEFGLNPDSSIKEIKTAYRSRMKDIHPDLAGVNAKHTTEFIHYQEVYERLIEFRKRLGLDL